jgi:hypothetical protein
LLRLGESGSSLEIAEIMGTSSVQRRLSFPDLDDIAITISSTHGIRHDWCESPVGVAMTRAFWLSRMCNAKEKIK